MTKINELLRVLRLPSIPTLALYAATLVAEVPVIFTRMLVTLAVAAIVLLIKGESLGGAEGLAELALIPTGWSIFALLTPFGGGWWWRANMGGRDPQSASEPPTKTRVQLLQAIRRRAAAAPEPVVRDSTSHNPTPRCAGTR